jgi:hypothetical protein
MHELQYHVWQMKIGVGMVQSILVKYVMEYNCEQAHVLDYDLIFERYLVVQGVHLILPLVVMRER